MKRNEYFTIPNLMGYFRILMIPVFLYLYYHADTTRDYVIAFSILAISFLTDLFDGKIARKFNMVTDFGKMLDPIADKLTQCAMAIAITFHYPVMGYFLAFFVCKEFYMGVMGLYILKKYNKIHGAQMYGKICTTIMDVCIFILLLFTELSHRMVNLIVLLLMGAMIYSWARYLLFHIQVIKEENKKR